MDPQRSASGSDEGDVGAAPPVPRSEERDPGSITVVETHVSTLLFTGDLVFKRKKPVDQGFLDFRTVEQRLAACRREVDLNRRLAPDVYLGVADVTLDGEELDHLVVMRRMPPERRLAALVDRPEVGTELDRVVDVVAEFHGRAERGPHVDDACTVDSLRELWRTGADQLQRFVPAHLDAASVERMWELASRYLAGRRPLIEDRLAAGRACDGHGDLLADDIFCLDDGPRLLDCLEFDDRLRYGDVLADVAFLAMDLQRLGHPELSRRLLDRYREVTGDRWPASLEHLFVAYRAHVRAKVGLLRAAQGDPDAIAAARRLHDLALEHLRLAEVRLVLVGGAPGTGKSTIATALAARLGAVRLSSDDLRGDVVPPEAGPPGQLHAGRYAPERSESVYAALLERAGTELAAGRSVVLDASWSTEARRAAARLVAGERAATLDELCCELPPEVAARRIAARAADGSDSSEVTPELAAQLSREREPWPEAASVRTDGSPEEAAEAAWHHLDAIDPPW